jgi:NAD(P)-dependent dehydrogenase (short-subunit alcohol dehydrogenase family)
VAVSSRGHIRSAIDFADPNFQHRDYEKRIAYGQSKTANALFAVDADRRGAGDGIRAFSLHPGGILTDLTRFMSEDEVRATGALGPDGRQIIDPSRNWKTPAQGAATTVWCAVSPQLAGMGGVYCENSDIALAVDGDSTALLGVRPWAMDAVAAERLWGLSERLTGVSLE